MTCCILRSAAEDPSQKFIIARRNQLPMDPGPSPWAFGRSFPRCAELRAVLFGGGPPRRFRQGLEGETHIRGRQDLGWLHRRRADRWVGRHYYTPPGADLSPTLCRDSLVSGLSTSCVALVFVLAVSPCWVTMRGVHQEEAGMQRGREGHRPGPVRFRRRSPGAPRSSVLPLLGPAHFH